MSSESSSDVSQLEALERCRVAPSSINLFLVDELIANGEVRTLFAQYRERFARTDLPGILLCFGADEFCASGRLMPCLLLWIS